MFKYKITFEYKYDENDYINDDLYCEIVSIEATEFEYQFETKKDIKDFETWYNVGAKNKLSINNIKITSDEEGVDVIVETENQIKEMQDFANELVDYLYETERYPSLTMHYHGKCHEPAWDDFRQGPTERTLMIDEDETFYLNEYKNIKIHEIK